MLQLKNIYKTDYYKIFSSINKSYAYYNKRNGVCR